MITRDNGNNYSDLCAKATEILRELDPGALGGQDAPDLADINDYFTVLGSMRKLVADKSKNVDPYFLILPSTADEEPFEINANTRTIKIPDAFKNGIGVQGDHFAEVIYFSIDRYFDATDLFEQEAFIQWEAPAQGTNQKDTGLTLAINKTIKLLPGKVVFGWPISENITKVPGNLKFSVRFFTREQEKEDPKKFTLKYNFSTLTATIKINPGLDFDLSDDTYFQALLEDNRDAVMALYKNSTAQGLDYPASIPVFVESSYNPFIGSYDLVNLTEGFSTRAKFDKDKDVNSFGTISYKWYHSTVENEKGNEITENNKKESYKEIETTVNGKNSSETFYIKEGDNYVKYSGNIIEGKTDEDKIEDRKTLYYKYASYMPEEAGWYYVKATNAAGRGNSAEADSGRWLINFAEEPDINIENFEHTIMKNDSATLSPTITTTGGETTYQWYKKVNKEDQATEIKGQTNGTLTVTEEGYYSIKAINERNKDTQKTTSGDMRVTYPASSITNLVYTYGGTPITSSDIIAVKLDQTKELSCTFDYDESKSDKIIYQWFILNDNDNSVTQIGEEKTWTPTSKGTYFIRISNNYNENIKIFNKEPSTDSESYYTISII